MLHHIHPVPDFKHHALFLLILQKDIFTFTFIVFYLHANLCTVCVSETPSLFIYILVFQDWALL